MLSSARIFKRLWPSDHQFFILFDRLRYKFDFLDRGEFYLVAKVQDLQEIRHVWEPTCSLPVQYLHVSLFCVLPNFPMAKWCIFIPMSIGGLAETCRAMFLFIVVSSKVDWVWFCIWSPALTHGFRMPPKVINQALIWYSMRSIGALLSFSTISRFYNRAPKVCTSQSQCVGFHATRKTVILFVLHWIQQRRYSQLLNLRSNCMIWKNSIASRPISIPSIFTAGLFHCHRSSQNQWKSPFPAQK